MELRPYQDQLIASLKDGWVNDGKRGLLQLPTGGGKTVIFSYVAMNTSKKGNRVLIISHRTELLTQAGGTLREFGLDPYLITADTKVIRDASVYVAMVNTLKNRLKHDDWNEWLKSISLIIIDECHRSDFAWINPKCHKMGVTATPKRSGKMPQLSDEYDFMVLGPDVQEMINMGFLLPDRYYGVPVDISGVGYGSDGDYNTSEMFGRYNSTPIYKGVIDNWVKYANNTTTICFCCNIQHCIQTTKELNEAGIKAKFLVSDVSKPKKPETDGKAAWTLYNRKMAEYENYKQYYDLYSGDRETIISEWKSGEFYILVNAGILVEGFDHKPTQTVIVLLSTTSENKWLQMLGRGSRPSPSTGKEFFIILDFGCNADRLGHYRQQRDYYLSHAESKAVGVPASKECPKCQALVIASSRICKYCGFEFPKSAEEVVVELVAVEYADKKPKQLDFKQLTYDQIEEYAKQRGYAKNWAWRTIYFSFGEEGLKAYAKKKGYHHSWVYQQLRIFKK